MTWNEKYDVAALVEIWWTVKDLDGINCFKKYERLEKKKIATRWVLGYIAVHVKTDTWQSAWIFEDDEVCDMTKTHSEKFAICIRLYIRSTLPSPKLWVRSHQSI